MVFTKGFRTAAMEKLRQVELQVATALLNIIVVEFHLKNQLV
jgi:hypothetical protein